MNPPTDLRPILRAAGLRVTAARLAVLRLFGEQRGPLSHNDVVEALASGEFDRATVYRNLVDLVEAGLLTRRDLGDHIWRYERASRSEEPEGIHPHFVCTSCGEIACLPAVTVVLPENAQLPQSMRKGGFDVQVRGPCDRCEAAI